VELDGVKAKAAESEALAAELAEVKDKLKMMRVSRDEHSAAAKAAADRLHAAEEAIALKSQQVAGLKEALQNAQRQVEATKKELDSSRANAAAFKQELAGARAEASQKDTRIRELAAEATELRLSIDTLKSVLVCFHVPSTSYLLSLFYHNHKQNHHHHHHNNNNMWTQNRWKKNGGNAKNWRKTKNSWKRDCSMQQMSATQWCVSGTRM